MTDDTTVILTKPGSTRIGEDAYDWQSAGDFPSAAPIKDSSTTRPIWEHTSRPLPPRPSRDPYIRKIKTLATTAIALAVLAVLLGALALGVAARRHSYENVHVGTQPCVTIPNGSSNDLYCKQP